MYHCHRCGHTFEEPGYRRELRGEQFGSPAYEEVACCPECGDTDYDDYGDRRCWDCIWKGEDGCTSWECFFVSRIQIRKMIKNGEIRL